MSIRSSRIRAFWSVTAIAFLSAASTFGQATVSAVDADSITIGLGSKAGVKKGLEAFIRDELDDINLAVIEITAVSETSSTAAIRRLNPGASRQEIKIDLRVVFQQELVPPPPAPPPAPAKKKTPKQSRPKPPPKSTDELLDDASRARFEGRINDAERLYERVLKRDPENDEAAMARAELEADRTPRSITWRKKAMNVTRRDSLGLSVVYAKQILDVYPEDYDAQSVMTLYSGSLATRIQELRMLAATGTYDTEGLRQLESEAASVFPEELRELRELFRRGRGSDSLREIRENADRALRAKSFDRARALLPDLEDLVGLGIEGADGYFQELRWSVAIGEGEDEVRKLARLGELEEAGERLRDLEELARNPGFPADFVDALTTAEFRAARDLSDAYVSACTRYANGAQALKTFECAASFERDVPYAGEELDEVRRLVSQVVSKRIGSIVEEARTFLKLDQFGRAEVLLEELETLGGRREADRIAEWIVARRRAPGALQSVSYGDAEFTFVWVAHGVNQVGSVPTEPCRKETEAPYSLEIPWGFWMLQTEITRAQWRAVMPQDPMPDSKCRSPFCPIQNVSWMDAQDFITRLNKLTDDVHGFRLPSEAEFEFAARAGMNGPFGLEVRDYETKYRKQWDKKKSCGLGKKIVGLDAFAWYRKSADGKPHAVKSLKANAWQLHDMHGNVSEWVQDLWADHPSDPREAYVNDAPDDPPGSTTRTLKGGAYDSEAFNVRAATRTGAPSSARRPNYGFRLVRGRLDDGQ